MKTRITFARIPPTRWDRRPYDISVNRAGKRIARLSYDHFGGRGWYWYGDGVNTVETGPRFVDCDAAKAHVRAHFEVNPPPAETVSRP